MHINKYTVITQISHTFGQKYIYTCLWIFEIGVDYNQVLTASRKYPFAVLGHVDANNRI